MNRRVVGAESVGVEGGIRRGYPLIPLPSRVAGLGECPKQGRSQRGDMGECPPRHGLKKNLAPELQTNDCFATGVTRQTLLIL